MIHMQWKIMSKNVAKQITEGLNGLNSSEFEAYRMTWGERVEETLDPNYLSLRKDIVEAYRKARETSKEPMYEKKADYYTDMFFGTMLYKILCDYGLSQRRASNDEIWIYLCVNVVPDIVWDRYPGATSKTTDGGLVHLNVNEERYWKTRRRIYLKVIWWYIHLSLQGGSNQEEQLNNTKRILLGNSTDEIVQVVERSGKEGYRIELYREIMKYYSGIKDSQKALLLRKVMKYNTARVVCIEPGLFNNGTEGYVRDLFKYFNH